MRGTFIVPKNVRLSAEVRGKSMMGGAARVAGKMLERPIAGVFAEGGDDFFVVVTIQRGAAPDVNADGDKARIGRRTVSFDGQRVVLE